MFKRKYVVVIVFMIAILVACSSKDDTQDVVASKNEQQSRLHHVEITLPSVLFEGQDFEHVIENAKAQGVSDVTKNDDGSVTYKMPKSVYNDMLKELESNVRDAVDKAKKKAKSIRDISYNDDFSEFTLVVNRQEYENSLEGFVSVTFGISGIFYQIYKGEHVDSATVSIMIEDEATGKVFDTIVYPDVLEKESRD